jgi:P27 family predicted phage terminase small subunit
VEASDKAASHDGVGGGLPTLTTAANRIDQPHIFQRVLNKKMGRRGPASKRLDGANGVEGRPTKPAWLKDEAAKLWPGVVRNLAALGTLSKSDALPIARYCRNFVAWLKADDIANQYGDMVFKTKNANEEKFKAMATAARRKRFQALALEKSLVQFERDFGLSAASRLNLQVETKTPASQVASRPRLLSMPQ